MVQRELLAKYAMVSPLGDRNGACAPSVPVSFVGVRLSRAGTHNACVRFRTGSRSVDDACPIPSRVQSVQTLRLPAPTGGVRGDIGPRGAPVPGASIPRPQRRQRARRPLPVAPIARCCQRDVLAPASVPVEASANDWLPSASANSFALVNRSAGSFSSAFATAAATFRRHRLPERVTASTGSAMIFMMICCAEPPRCGGCPASISYSTRGQRVDVAARADLLLRRRLLGRHVVRRS